MSAHAPPLSVLSDCLRLDRKDRGRPLATPNAVDWQAVIAFANEHLLGPALHARLSRRPGRAAAPPEVFAYLGLLHRLNCVRNQALRQQAIEIIRAFNNAGIVPMILKGGIVLFDSPYPRRAWSTRMMRDLDFMVRPADLDRATAALTTLGYGILNRYPAGHHAFAEFSRATDPAAVDLHTELVDPHYVLPAADVWSRARPLPTPGLAAVAPAPTERMLHHFLHAQVHYLADFYRGELRLDQLYEFAAMGSRFGSEIEWLEIARRIERHRLATPLHSYLFSAGELFGLQWPLAAMPRLAARFHHRRCRVQMALPVLRRVTVPWGNLRAAFAWHRMKARYGTHGWLVLWQAHHAWRFLRAKSMRAAWGRMFRTE